MCSRPTRVTVGGVDDLRGANALLTGAAGGLGRHIARALAEQGVRLAVSGRREEPLLELCAELRQAHGADAVPLLADLDDPAETAGLVEDAEAAIGPLDLLINNAGLELPAAFQSFTDDELATVTRVNQIAPMVLARHALPGMLARDRGHIVTVSSLAGRGNSYNVLYATTKAGLVGFSRSLRAELAGTSVGASVICPGFVARDGMYAEMQRFGINAPIALRAVEPERVAHAVIEAIRQDRPDTLVTYWPMRPLLAVQELAPRVAGWAVAALGADRFFEQLVDRTGRGEAEPRETPALR